MKILDAFCGAGGAAMGLHQYFPEAEILGIDFKPQPHYPFAFEMADAMTYPLSGFDFIWTSPPCQGYSIMRHLPRNRDKDYPLLIEPLRERLRAQDTPWIIENVMGAQRKAAMGANWLCGTMFGKRFYRHRVFESNFAWWMPGHPKHTHRIRPGYSLGSRARDIIFAPHFSGDKPGFTAWQQAAAEDGCVLATGHAGVVRHRGTSMYGGEGTIGANSLSHAKKSMIEAARREMEIDWMRGNELSQAVPPCYSRYLAHWIPA